MPPSLKLFNSDLWRYRLIRHALFWLLYLITYSAIDLDEYSSPYAGLELVVRWLPFTMLNTYVTVYWLVGRYLLRSRYLAFFLLFGAWLIALIPLAFLSHVYLCYPYCWPAGPRPSLRQALPELFDIYPILVCEVITGIAAFLRMHKFWRSELAQKLQLKKETTEAELKLLKAQLNPHFLFNTLNNLYTLILRRSNRAPDMLLRLTAILDHVLRQGHSVEVPLSQEIDFCRDYIELEKERYGARLRIVAEFSGDLEHRSISPMLFQPLIENAFKHGASEQLGKVWIEIRLTVADGRLFFEVANSAAGSRGAVASDGIGVANIRRRLQLLYPGRHRLIREQGETQHSVCLAIDLGEAVRSGGSRATALSGGVLSGLLVAALLMPGISHAQKVTRDVRPDNHQVWLVTDDVDLNFRIIQNSAIFAHFRTEGPDIFMYMSGAGQLSSHDYAYFITDGDTIMVYSTGMQPGGWNGNNPYHEYRMTEDELKYLSVHLLKTVVVSHYGGWQSTAIPAKDQAKLQPYCLAVLKNL